MLIDCFTFFNETNLLEARLQYYYDTVDRFIISEGNLTFSGNAKPYNFLDNYGRYAKYFDKIVYLQCDLTVLDTTDPWIREKYQRNYLSNGLKVFDENAVVVLSDIDEIVRKEMLYELHHYVNSLDITNVGITPGLEMFYGNFNYKLDKLWIGPVVVKNKFILEKTPEVIRNTRMTCPNKIPFGGYHMSCWNSLEDVSYKLKNFSHQEFNQEKYTNIDTLRELIATGKDIVQREHENYVKVDRGTIDPEILDLFGKYEIKV